jgi:hypothetical protein
VTLVDDRSFRELIAEGIEPEEVFLEGIELRNYEIVFKRASGLTLEDIGLEYGLTREAIRQIVVRNFGSSMKLELREREAKVKIEAASEIHRLEAYILEHKGITLSELLLANPESNTLKISDFAIDVKKFIFVEEVKKTAPVVWSDEQVISSIQKAALYFFPLAKDDYDKLVKAGEIVGPSSALIMKRFSYWSRACALAGVESHSVSGHYTKKWSVEEQLDFLRQFLICKGIGSSIAFYNTWQKNVNPHAPSAQLLRNTFEGWQPAIQAVLMMFRNEWNAPKMEES